jgi:hypothetical protein
MQERNFCLPPRHARSGKDSRVIAKQTFSWLCPLPTGLRTDLETQTKELHFKESQFESRSCLVHIPCAPEISHQFGLFEVSYFAGNLCSKFFFLSTRDRVTDLTNDCSFARLPYCKDKLYTKSFQNIGRVKIFWIECDRSQLYSQRSYDKMCFPPFGSKLFKFPAPA